MPPLRLLDCNSLLDLAPQFARCKPVVQVKAHYVNSQQAAQQAGSRVAEFPEHLTHFVQSTIDLNHGVRIANHLEFIHGSDPARDIVYYAGFIYSERTNHG